MSVEHLLGKYTLVDRSFFLDFFDRLEIIVLDVNNLCKWLKKINDVMLEQIRIFFNLFSAISELEYCFFLLFFLFLSSHVTSQVAFYFTSSQRRLNNLIVRYMDNPTAEEHKVDNDTDRTS